MKRRRSKISVRRWRFRKSGNSGDRDYLAAIATERCGGLGAPFASVWLPTLLRLRPEAGVEVLETGLKKEALFRGWAQEPNGLRAFLMAMTW